MAFQEQENQFLRNPETESVLDGLYCEEVGIIEEDCTWVNDRSRGSNVVHYNGNDDNYHARKESSFSCFLPEQDLFWDADELSNLISREKDTHFDLENKDLVLSNGSLVEARKEAIDWVLRVNAHYGFTPLTSVLAVNYFDRFVLSLKFPNDKPWTGQLAAVACLSLAAKVEETQVPLLLDLQVEEAKYIFEAKTIKRMELLVLSTLQWRMNPVTPISFFNHIVRRLGLNNLLQWEFLRSCERLLLCVISDSRSMSFLPSVLATAVMLHVIKEVEPSNQVEYQNQLMSVLKIGEDRVNECYKFIMDLSGNRNQSCKRKYPSTPSSPNGVIDAYYSCDSSNDSWNVSSMISSSPLPRSKKSRTQDQQMRLHSLNRMFLDVLSSPY